MALEHVKAGLFPHEDTRLRAAEELIARAGDRVRARADGALQRRLAVDAERFKVEKAAAAEVLEKRQAAGMSERGKLLAARALGKADDAVVAGVDLHQRAGMLTDGGGIVRGAGLVGRADLAQRRAAGGHDLRHTKAAADLDQLAARNDDLAAGGQRREEQQHGGGVVVDDQSAFRTGQSAEEFFDMGIARAASAAFHIVFKGRIVLRGVRRGFGRASAQTGAAEIRMEYDAGCVDDRTERGRFRPAGGVGGKGAERRGLRYLRRFTGKDALPQRVERAAHRRGHRRGGGVRAARVRGGKQLVHLGDIAQHRLVHLSVLPSHSASAQPFAAIFAK